MFNYSNTINNVQLHAVHECLNATQTPTFLEWSSCSALQVKCIRIVKCSIKTCSFKNLNATVLHNTCCMCTHMSCVHCVHVCTHACVTCACVHVYIIVCVCMMCDVHVCTACCMCCVCSTMFTKDTMHFRMF